VSHEGTKGIAVILHNVGKLPCRSGDLSIIEFDVIRPR